MGERTEPAEAHRPATRYDLERGWVPLAALVFVLALPMVLAVIGVARAGWVPTGDSGTIALRALDMWGSGRPLVGQFSLAGPEGTDQVFSPGPLLYVLLAPAARFGPDWTLPATMALWSTGCFAVALAAARRIAGWWFAVLVTFALLATMRASGADAYAEVWNPWSALAPFAALILVCWLVALGNRRWLVVAVVLSSFAVQAHLTYLAPSAVLLAIALVGGWWPASPSEAEAADPDGAAGAQRWRPLLVAGAAGLVCWAAPLLQQVRDSPGNLRLIAGAVRDPAPVMGPSVGVNVWWRASGLLPAFARDRSTQVAELGELRAAAGPAAWIGAALLAAALVAVAWAARRRGQRDVLVGALIALGLGAAAVSTAAKIPIDRSIVAPYALRWTVTAGVVPWVVFGLAASRFGLLARWGRSPDPRRGAAIAVAVLLVLAVLIPRSDRSAWLDDPARETADAVVAATAPGDRVMLANSFRYDLVMTPALAYQLRREGRVPVLVRATQVATGAAYARNGDRCDTIVYLRPAAKPVRPNATRLGVVVLDPPGGTPDEMAIEVEPDPTRGGRC